MWLLLVIPLIVPTALADWVPMAGPEGANIIAFGTHGSYLFAGTYGAGVMRSSDNGGTWTAVNSGFGYPAPNGFLSQGGVLYAATVGVYRSTDNGATWNSGTGLSSAVAVSSLATDGTRLYASMPSTGSTPLGVFRSTDGGTTWVGSNTGIPSNSGVNSLCVTGGKILAAVGGSTYEIYQSTDNGVTWTVSGTGATNQYVAKLVATPSAVLASTSTNGVLRSTNSGSTWAPSNAGLPASANVTALFVDGATVYAAVSPSGSPAMLYQSTNAGASWNTTGLTAPPVQVLTAITRSGSHLVTGSVDQGMHRSSDNGATWSRANAGAVNSRVKAVAVLGGAVFAGTAADGVFRTTDGGATWTWLRNGLPGTFRTGSVVTRGSVVIAVGSVRDSVYAWRSADQGNTWTRGALIPGFAIPPTQRGVAVNNGVVMMVRGTGEILRSTDDGASWTAGTGIAPGSFFSALGVHAGSVFAGGTTMYRSTNDGVSWSASATGIPSFPSLIAIASAGGNVFAGGEYAPAVYRSTNNGSNWATTGPVPGAATNDLLGVGSALFAGVINAGVYISTNSGTSWTTIRTGLPTVAVTYHYLGNDAANLYCATDTRGVWRRPLSEVTEVREIAAAVPEEMGLEQNYPNPFNPATVIRFRMQGAGKARLSVYDLLGREVAVLMDGDLAPGSYEATFDASGLSSGVYMYRLVAGDAAMTRRMVLAR